MDKWSLADKLRKYSYSYYRGSTEVEDAEFDALKQKLVEIDPDDETGFQREVGSPPDKFKYQHEIPMGSLDNVNNEEELRKWYNKLPSKTVVIQPKYDGLSVGMSYKNGSLHMALTRGDGVNGEAITDNVLHTMYASGGRPSIKTLTEPVDVSVRGEGIIFKEDFNEANFPGESNPRNSAAGSIRDEDSTRARWIRIVCYDMSGEFKTEVEKLSKMQMLGLPVTKYWVAESVEDILKVYNEIVADRDNLPYAVDGLAMKLNNIELQKKMGEHNNRPKGQRAFKFPCMSAVTTLRKVELAVGHTGYITLRGHYDPVEIDGRTFEHTNLDNYDLLEKMGLGIGSEILIYIAGDIIPKTKKVINPSYTCPECGFAGTLEQQKLHHS